LSNKRIAARIGGNWGISFFGPLTSTSVAESFYDIGLTFEQTLFISLLSSVFVTGLVISRELQRYGQKEK